MRTKDVVVIASLINIAVVALIFSTSLQRRTDAVVSDRTAAMRFEQPIVAVADPLPTKSKTVNTLPLCLDEIDVLLQEYEKGSETSTKEESVTVSTPKVAPTPKAAPTPQYQIYTIQEGDSPWKIAKRFGMSSEDLLKINGLDTKSAKNLKIGQTIKIVNSKGVPLKGSK